MRNKWRNDILATADRVEKEVDEIKIHHPQMEGLRTDVVIVDEVSHYMRKKHQRRNEKNMNLAQILAMVAPTEKVTLRKGRDGEEWDCTAHHASKYANHRVIRIEAEAAHRVIIEVEEQPAPLFGSCCAP